MAGFDSFFGQEGVSQVAQRNAAICQGATHMSSVGKPAKNKSPSKSTMLGRTKTRPISLRFRQDMPGRILIEARKRYASYLMDENPLEDWRSTDQHEKTIGSLTPGDWIFHLREANGLAQGELGRKLGKVSGSRISDWEANRRAVSKAMAKKLSLIFNVSPDRFI